VTLCEVSEKRVSFLHEAERRLAAGVEILPLRAEEIVSQGRRFSHVVSRATFSPLEWRALGMQLCSSGGLVWSMWSEDQEVPFLGEDLFRFRYRLADGRQRVITAIGAP
jgi:16S rRNA G527 N7-methylase RsmG